MQKTESYILIRWNMLDPIVTCIANCFLFDCVNYKAGSFYSFCEFFVFIIVGQSLTYIQTTVSWSIFAVSVPHIKETSEHTIELIL